MSRARDLTCLSDVLRTIRVMPSSRACSSTLSISSRPSPEPRALASTKTDSTSTDVSPPSLKLLSRACPISLGRSRAGHATPGETSTAPGCGARPHEKAPLFSVRRRAGCCVPTQSASLCSAAGMHTTRLRGSLEWLPPAPCPAPDGVRRDATRDAMDRLQCALSSRAASSMLPSGSSSSHAVHGAAEAILPTSSPSAPSLAPPHTVVSVLLPSSSSSAQLKSHGEGEGRPIWREPV